MSYGWLTESSLQPKPGRAIDVPSGSLLNLKAAIYRGEEEAQKRRAELGGGARLKPTKKFRPRHALLMDGRNKNVEERDKRDEEFAAESSKDFDCVRRRLEEKSKIYAARMAAAGRGGEFVDDDEGAAEWQHDGSRSRESRKRQTSSLRGGLVDFELKAFEGLTKTREKKGDAPVEETVGTPVEGAIAKGDGAAEEKISAMPNQRRGALDDSDLVIDDPGDVRRSSSIGGGLLVEKPLMTDDSRKYLEKVSEETLLARQTGGKRKREAKEVLRAELRQMREAAKRKKDSSNNDAHGEL